MKMKKIVIVTKKSLLILVFILILILFLFLILILILILIFILISSNATIRPTMDTEFLHWMNVSNCPMNAWVNHLITISQH